MLGEEKEMLGYIYKLNHLPTGKYYIGQTIDDIQQRIDQHWANAANSKGKYKLSKLYNAINKYKPGSDWRWEVLRELYGTELGNKYTMKDVLNYYEVDFIEKYLPDFNILSGGQEFYRNSRSFYIADLYLNETGRKLPRRPSGRPKGGYPPDYVWESYGSYARRMLLEFRAQSGDLLASQLLDSHNSLNRVRSDYETRSWR
ncbi:MAG: GIY-YIG nuclease family protein [Alphaproteobacteria bacterium]|nr:GIY-YIG nuclease family protein [Alphaproteobacteria bacterium]